jgi:hypothetical protein
MCNPKGSAMVRLHVLAALLVLAIPAGAANAGPDPAEPDQWSCTGSAHGARGAEVDVNIMVETDGTVVEKDAAWTPPTLSSGPAAKGAPGASPGLSITYFDAGEAGLGPPTGVLATASIPRRHRRLLEGARVSLGLDGGLGWAAPLESLPWARDYPPFAFRSAWLASRDDLSYEPDAPDAKDGDDAGGRNRDLLAALATAGVAHMALAAADGRLLASADYDLTARAQRDQLFAGAWAAARLAIRHPRRCIKAIAQPDIPSPPVY